MWSPWGSWSQCSKTCEHGTRKRTRLCNHPEPAFNGTFCAGIGHETQNCSGLPACPINGMWGSWSSWSACSKTCGQGTRERKRLCDNPKPDFSGNKCLGSDIQKENCSALLSCPTPIDGMWSPWGSWSQCSKTCEHGTRKRTRLCNHPEPAFNGTFCAGIGHETQNCSGLPACPINGMWGSWSSWSACSKTCGQGTRERKRLCDNPKPDFSGNKCLGSDIQKENCSALLSCP
ncbi:unnamed protein product, partial [Porites evermanni]